MSRRHSFSLVVCCLLLLAGSLALARPDSDFLRRDLRLNAYGASGQGGVSLAMGPDGELLTAWESRRQQEGRYGAFARRLDAVGRLDGAELPVALSADSHRRHPVVAWAGGTAWLVWEAWGQDGEAGGIVARRPGGDEMLLNTERAGSQEAPVALGLDDGRLLAVWTTPGTRPGSRALSGRLLDAGGEPLGDEFAIATRRDARDRQPALAALPGGGFAVAWQRELEGGSDILLRRFAADATPLAPARIAIAGGIEPVLAAQGDALLLGWLALDPSTEAMRTRLARIAGDGEMLLWEAPGAELPGWQSALALATNARGEAVAAWNQVSADGEDSDVRVRRYAPDGSPAAAELAHAATAGWQGLTAATASPRLALGADGRIALAWEGDSARGDASAANVTLFLPAPGNPIARLWQRGRLALSDLAERLSRDDADASFAAGAALPHQPPVFDPSALQVPDPEPFWPGGGGRDEGWQAINNTGWSPPDPHMAVSDDHVMVMTNGGIAAYDRDGNELWFEDISGGGGFWGELGIGTFVFDPEVIFDPHSQRFMVMACERTNGSYFDIGISSTSDPTDPWHKYRLNVTALAGSDIDSPELAVDDAAIYLTADFFSPDTYLIYIIDKASVIDGGTPVTTHTLHTGSQSFGIPVQYGAAPDMYMVEAFETTSANSIRLWAIQDPLGSPGLVSTTLTVDSYWDPPSARSQGTSATISTFEARFWSCVYRDGSLWACHHIAPDASRTSVASRWYQIEMNGWPDSGSLPTLRQSGQVQPGGTGYATFNSISVNAAGDAAMCFAYSSTSDYLGMWRAARLAGDPLGTMNDVQLVKNSTGAYTGSRWGDYSATVVDPGGYEFWMAHEYAIGGSWSTWVSHFITDLTAAPDFAAAGPRMGQAWPNPTADGSSLSFALPSAASVRLEIFDVEGRRVRSLERGDLPAGEHSLRWDGRDEAGQVLAAGQYLTRLAVDGRTVAGPKITLVK